MNAYNKDDSFSLESDSIKDVIRDYICWLSMTDETRPSIGNVFKAMETFKIDAVRYCDGDIYELAKEINVMSFDSFIRSLQNISSKKDKLTVYGTMGLLSIVMDINKGRDTSNIKFAAGIIILMEYIFDDTDLWHLTVALYRRIQRRYPIDDDEEDR
ncbi:CPXV030 protein [Cowpox virus]|uniref:CPXV030 protein n=1 Tax=Cowpox virus TaxID=10243 RepID=A0A212Q371_COWPX|nr:CPXV030 protein [Cowpox virus]SNB53760.1 CPXV030 protein [Cowpox virus]